MYAWFMIATPPHSFEVFTPLQPFEQPEGVFKGVAERIQQVVHGLFATIEAEALPPPEDATVASETTALIHALPLRDAAYDIGYRLSSLSRFSERFATQEEWGEPAEGGEPVVTFETSVDVVFGQEDGDRDKDKESELLKSIFAMRRLGSPVREDTVITVHDESLMGVAGMRIGGRFRRQYAYDAERQAEVREKIGRALVQTKTAQVDAAMFVSLPVQEVGFLFAGGPNIDLRSRIHQGRGGVVIPPTPPELVVPSLRVVHALVSRSTV